MQFSLFNIFPGVTSQSCSPFLKRNYVASTCPPLSSALCIRYRNLILNTSFDEDKRLRKHDAKALNKHILMKEGKKENMKEDFWINHTFPLFCHFPFVLQIFNRKSPLTLKYVDLHFFALSESVDSINPLQIWLPTYFKVWHLL